MSERTNALYCNIMCSIFFQIKLSYLTSDIVENRSYSKIPKIYWNKYEHSKKTNTMEAKDSYR